MTVEQLIEKLRQCEKTAVVKVVSQYNGSYQEACTITSGPVVVFLDVSEESENGTGRQLQTKRLPTIMGTKVRPERKNGVPFLGPVPVYKSV